MIATIRLITHVDGAVVVAVEYRDAKADANLLGTREYTFSADVTRAQVTTAVAQDLSRIDAAQKKAAALADLAGQEFSVV